MNMQVRTMQVTYKNVSDENASDEIDLNAQSQERFIIFCSHIKTNQRKGRYTTTEGKKQEGTK